MLERGEKIDEFLSFHAENIARFDRKNQLENIDYKSEKFSFKQSVIEALALQHSIYIQPEHEAFYDGGDCSQHE